MDMPVQYTRNELKVLWHLKRKGGFVTNDGPHIPGTTSLINVLAAELDMRVTGMRYQLKTLEEKSLILRTYLRAKATSFDEHSGYNPLVRIELIDPGMWLPELPAPMPLGVVMQHENEDLAARVEARNDHEPTPEAIILALVERNEELRQVIDKLHQVITDQQAEMDSKARIAEQQAKRRNMPEHLTNRVQDSLPPETWHRLRGQE